MLKFDISYAILGGESNLPDAYKKESSCLKDY